MVNYNKQTGKTIGDLKETINHPFFLVRLFFTEKFDEVIKMAKLNKQETILDFGAGEGYLKKRLKGYNIINYEVNKEQTDVEDYTLVTPDKIIAVDVFEHLHEREIREVITNFKDMNKNFELIVCIPTETFFWKLARLLTGKQIKVPDHHTKLKEILEILKEELEEVEHMSFLSLSYIAKFKGKNGI